MITYKNRNKKGFTIIELIVVIAIVAILASIVIINVSKYAAKARDMRRLADMHTLATAIKIYQGEHGGSYPSACVTSPCSSSGYGWENTNNDDPGYGFISVLTRGSYLPSGGIKDPTNSGVYYYYYSADGATSGFDSACCNSTGAKAAIIFFTESTLNNPYVNNDCSWNANEYAVCLY